MNRPYHCLRSTVLLGALSAATLLVGCHDSNNPADGSGTPTPPAAVAPSITSQPMDQSVTAGQSASFSVTASGTAPLTYQWQRSGTAISGATGSTYMLASAAVTDSGAEFTVIVGNSAGSVTSNPGKLTVQAAGTVVHASAGGQVTSSDGRVTITFPPNALTADATVTVTAAADETLPSSLSNQFTVIAGTTYVISTQGGALDPNKRLQVNFLTSGLTGLQSVAVPDRRILSARRHTNGQQPEGSSGSTPWDDLGIVVDCGGGQAVVVTVPPSTDYAGNFIAGCQGGSGGSSQSTVALSTWTTTSSPQTPGWQNTQTATGWQTTVPFVDNSPDTILAPYRIDSTTRSDSWMGNRPATISASSIGLTIDATKPGNEQTLVTMVDGTGQLIAQQLLPVRMTSISLDGRAGFYLTLGLGHYSKVGPLFSLGGGQPLAAYVAYYSVEVNGNGAVFQRQWERTITGAPATASGNDVYGDAINPLAGGNFSAVGTIFASDPNSGDLVGLGGNGNSSGSLTDDEVARLGFAADGFIVRIDRSGKLKSAAPVTQPLTYMGTAIDSSRILDFSMRLDHAGNAYVAALGCCDATGQNPYGISGLTLKKFDPAGHVLWDVSVASPDDVNEFPPGATSPSYQIGPPIAIDSVNDVYLTYSRNYPPPGSGTGLYVSKVSTDVGTVSAIGPINYLVVTYLIGQSETGITSFMDDSGVLYVPNGSAEVQQLTALSTTSSPIFSKIGSTPNPLETGHADHAFQVDSSGNIFQQQTATSSTDGYQHNATYTVTLTKDHF